MIHICYSLYDKNGKYSKNVGTSMCSVFENTREWITIHLLHDNTLSESNKALFIRLVRKYGQHICFYNMDELGLPYGEAVEAWGEKARYSKAAFYRLLIGEVLPFEVKRCIYLDSDVICNLDIKELWQEDLGGAPLGAISEHKSMYGHMLPKAIINDGTVEEHRYFNSGVLLIDLPIFSKIEGILRNGLEMLAKNPSYTLYDQDILNYYFAAVYQPLNIRYNLFVQSEKFVGHELQSAIYHYAGQAFCIYQGDAFDKLYAKYYVMSPWFTGDAFLDACHTVTTAMTDLINSFWKFARGRSFTIVGNDEDMERFQKLFDLGQGDRFLSLYDKPNFINTDRIIADMKKHISEIDRSKPLYMFIAPSQMIIKKVFLQISKAGFKEGVDFVNATWLVNALEHNYPKSIGDYVWERL